MRHLNRIALLALATAAMMATGAAAASANVEYVDASSQEPCGEISVIGESVFGGCDVALSGSIDFYTETEGQQNYVTSCSLILEGQVDFEGTAYVGNGTDFHSCELGGTDPINLAWGPGSVSFTEGAPYPPPFQGKFPDEYLVSTPFEYELWGYDVTGGDVAVNLLADGSGSWQGGTDGLDPAGTVDLTGVQTYVDIDVSGTQSVEAVEGS
ncbi:MAG: hypothetical protein WD404_08070 [Solirubrobacterales bacterium]